MQRNMLLSMKQESMLLCGSIDVRKTIVDVITSFLLIMYSLISYLKLDRSKTRGLVITMQIVVGESIKKSLIR